VPAAVAAKHVQQLNAPGCRRIAFPDRRRPAVAVAYIQEFAIEDRSTTNYDAVAEKLRDVVPEGGLIHTAGFDDDAGVFRIFDVWETREHGERFLDEMMASRPDLQPPVRETWYELHDVMTG
jgi:hypothetical protein